MGAAAEAAFRCWTVLRAVSRCLSVEDLFSFARCDTLWEEVTLPLLSRRLRFFALFQEQFGSRSLSQAFAEELEFRLRLAQKAERHPVLAMVFCSYKQYDASSLASRFPDQTSVVQVYVEEPMCFTRRGDTRCRSASLCVLVLFRYPGVELECERAPCAACRKAAAPTASIVGVKRKHQRRCANRASVTFRHRGTGYPARLAFYASSAFNKATFRSPPILNHVASCMLWTNRLKVLRPVTGEPTGRPLLWGSILYGDVVRACSLKYPAKTTIRQMAKHLEGARDEFGNVEEALVLFFQEGKIDVSVCEVIRTVFRGAAVILGAVNSLALDVGPFYRSTEPEDTVGLCWTVECVGHIDTPVIVTLLGIR
ncbi:hypothetical protein HPB52_004184 [Rhipicephalus sanguineus]|uniref:Uncharacterized protein n=1 Tax=Rhipicephalus sanguineus TaxID=34632 RepID=A0A9D4PNM4_RHISA|nr:hypothetical protein HPB52_004184 [Rhipicephalus sanguineus]